MSTKFAIIFAVIALLVAYSFDDIKNILQNKFLRKEVANESLESKIIGSWKKYAVLPDRKLNRNFRIAIGMNTNVDLILSGTDLFKTLKIDSTDNNTENCQAINSLMEFKQCFKYFFKKGSAAERSFRSQSDFDHVLDGTKNLKKKYFIGGNAGLMAESISTKLHDVDIFLVGPVGGKLKSLLNKKIQVPYVIEKDEVHLILEYNVKEIFDEIETPTANRFIVSHDVYNSNLKMLNEYFEVIKKYSPDIVILSGLHLLESQESKARQVKLDALKEKLVENHEIKNVVHLELASIGDKSLMKSILDINFLNEIDSLGLNEQELLYLSHVSGKAPHSNYYNELDGQPNLLKVIDILEWILNTYGQSVNNPNSRLTRIHFHCLVFHLVVVKNNSKWSNIQASIMAGSKIASKQASGFEFHDEHRDEILEELVEFKMNHENTQDKQIKFKINTNEFITFKSNNPISEFNRADIKFYFTPVLVCKKPLKTVGLGDAISSIGLVYSLYNH